MAKCPKCLSETVETPVMRLERKTHSRESEKVLRMRIRCTKCGYSYPKSETKTERKRLKQVIRKKILTH